MTQGNTFKRLDPLVALMTRKSVEAKRKVKLELQSKMFSCTALANLFQTLWHIYDQQNVRFIISFLSSI